jgi:catalase
MFDGSMTMEHASGQAVCAPNSTGLPFCDLTGPADEHWEADATMVRSAYELHAAG